MKVSNETFQKIWTYFMVLFRKNGLAREVAGDEPPLRAELFSSDQMKRHAKALADSHKLSSGRASDLLLTRLAENEGVLIGARKPADRGG